MIKRKMRMSSDAQKVLFANMIFDEETDGGDDFEENEHPRDSSGKFQSKSGSGDTTGRYGKGNIDLNNRPIHHNDDGSISTEISLSFFDEDYGQEVLIPTVIDGEIVSDDDAIDHYYETGEYLGRFDTPEEADEYAEMLHERQDWYYNQGGKEEAESESSDEE